MLRLLAILLLLSGSVAAVAGETVMFGNGRRLRVEASRLEKGVWVLEMANGGVIRVPEISVARVVPDPETEPPAAVEADCGMALDAFLARQRAGDLGRLIRRAAAAHRLEVELLAAVAFAESAFDPRAVSPKGAMGLMQLMPATAERFGVDEPFDPWQSLNAGAAYLSQLSAKYGGDLRLALAAYNAGEGRVATYRGMPPFSETVAYVSRVMGLYHSLHRDG